MPQFLSTSMVYELPFGKGHAYLQSGPLAWIVGGWQANSIFSIRSGQPFGILVNGDVANVAGEAGTPFGLGYGRANQTGDPHLSHPTRFKWFNTDAFSVPDHSFGNAPRNGLSSDHVTQFDFSTFKKFPITEKGPTLEFRAEAFNISTSSTTPHPAATRSVTPATAPSPRFSTATLPANCNSL